MKNKKGFTIVELVIVIAVIAILAAVLIPTFSGVISKANESSALQTARSTLTNVLNMSSTAQLAGKTEKGTWKTVFVVDGHAYGYTGNQLEAINYPGYKGENQLKKDANSTNTNNFNSIIIAAENLEGKDYELLTAEPSDWNTIWADCYKKTADVYSKVTGASAPTFVAGTFYKANFDFTIATAIWNIIKVDGDGSSNGVTELAGTTGAVKKVTDEKGTAHYYLNYTDATTYDAEVFINSDLSNKVVVFTTFGR